MIGTGNLGNAYRILGRLDDALMVTQETVERARDLGDMRMLGEALCNMGLTYVEQRRLDEARAYLEDGRACLKTAGYRFQEARPLPALSRVCRELGDLDAARRYAEQGLELARQIGDRIGEAAALRELDQIIVRVV